jgi:hypothetical protein
MFNQIFDNQELVKTYLVAMKANIDNTRKFKFGVEIPSKSCTCIVPGSATQLER